MKNVKLIYMFTVLSLFNGVKHQNPFSHLKKLNLIQTYQTLIGDANTDNDYGHYSLQDALEHNITCEDQNYVFWVRRELGEWVELLSKTQEGLTTDKNRIQNLQTKVVQVCSTLDLTQNVLLGLRGSQNLEALNQANVYTYFNTCIWQLVEQLTDEKLLSEKVEICKEILKPIDELTTQITWLLQNHDRFPQLKEIVLQRKNELCCDITCKHCSGQESNECTRCETSTRQQLTQNNECPCIESYFEQRNAKCTKCEQKCLECIENALNCTVCSENRQNPPVCQCISKYYEKTETVNNIVTITCEICHYSCNECTGPDLNQCKELSGCPIGREYSNGECKPKPGHYDLESTPVAPQCHWTCTTCYYLPNIPLEQQCLTCGSFINGQEINRLLEKMHGDQGTCKCTKTEGYGWDKTELEQKVCEKCNLSCKWCINGAFESCTDCPANKTLKQLQIINGVSVGTCEPDEGFYCGHCNNNPTGQFPEPGIPCHSACIKCLSDQDDECTVCKTDLDLVKRQETDTFGACICKYNQNWSTQLITCIACEENQYWAENQQACVNCHITCKTCIGTGSNDCTSCLDDQFEDRYQFILNPDPNPNKLGNCDPNSGFYKCSNIGIACQCDPICAECVENQTQCTICKGNKDQNDQPLRIPTINGDCFCKDGYRDKYYEFQDISEIDKFDCVECDKFAAKCRTVPGGETAIECKQNRVKSEQILNGNEIIQVCVCPQNFYSKDDSIECYPCSEICLECQQRDNYCTKCKDGLILIENTNICPSCQPFQFLNGLTCENCHNACESCHGTTGSNCVESKDPNTNEILQNKVHYIFVIESSLNMDKPYDKLSKDGTLNNSMFPEFNTKYQLAQHAIDYFIISKIQQEQNYFPVVKDDITLINFGTNVVNTSYQEHLFENSLINSFPTNLISEYKGDINNAIIHLLSVPVVNKVDLVSHKYHIIFVLDGDNLQITLQNEKTEFVNQVNNIKEKLGDSLISQQFITLQSNLDLNNCLPVNGCQSPQSPELFIELITPIQAPNKEKPVCINGYYMDDEKFENQSIYCIACPSLCSKCESPEICNECNSSKRYILGGQCVCIFPYEEVNNQCSDPCKDNEYRDSIGSCQNCDPSCVQCTGPLASQCSDCKAGQFLQDINGIKTCENCKSECATCDNYQTCNTCKNQADEVVFHRIEQNGQCICENGYQVKAGTLQCQIICQEHQFRMNDTICENCHITCETCFGKEKINCLTCYEVQNRTLNNNSCVPIPGYFEKDPEDETATKCDNNCKECVQTADNCTKCHDNNFAFQGSNPQTCVCITGYYLVEQLNNPDQCLNCDLSCENCQGPLVTDCKSCNINDYRQENVVLNSNTVSCVCNDGFSDFIITSAECEKCHYTCKTCNSNNANGCLTCESNRQLILNEPLQLSGFCPPIPGFYECTQNNGPACPCNPWCRECKDSNAINNCTECLTDDIYKHVKKDSIQEITECIAGPGTYLPTCSLPPCPAQNCDPNCKECVRNSTTCTECFEDRQLDLSTNYCDCLTGYIKIEGQCEKCNYSCNTCYSLADCIQCKEGFVRASQGNLCVCQIGFFERNQVCVSCPFKCVQCTSETNCTECYNNRAGILCDPLTSCFEPIPQNKDALCCHINCQTCNGTEQNNCLTCDSGLNRVSIVVNNECPCKDGYFDKSYNGTCYICHNSCETCSSTGKFGCLTCIDQLELKTEGSYQFCSEKCNEQGVNYYYNEITQSIQECDRLCKCCVNGTDEDCTKCLQNSHLPVGSTFGKCIANPGYVISEPNKEIQPCTGNCSECGGTLIEQKIPSYCIACKEPFTLTGPGICDCQAGTYPLDGTCIQCSQDCQICTDINLCVTCKGNNTIVNELGLCVCQEGYVNYNQILEVSCIKLEVFSIQVTQVGIIVGEGNDSEGSINVPGIEENPLEICVKNINVIAGNHDAENNTVTNEQVTLSGI